uniref:Non-ribosomal peptide synthetase B n=1 Tax=Actinoplanes friuliensis TaxID=196914 RepID=Q4H1C8_9ACTN|nr:non-ribosomal peptide synthetase B [Actinoplanes friuliensis]
MTDVSVDRRPVSAAQLGIWVAQQVLPDSPLYNCGCYYEIGAADPVLLDRAVRHAVAETEALRSRFETIDDELWQLVGPAEPEPLEVVDLSAEADPQEAAQSWMRAAMAGVRPLGRGPLSRQAVLLLGADRRLWFHGYHHAVLDGFGQSVYASRVAEVYAALAAGQAPPPRVFTTLDEVHADAAVDPSTRRYAADRDYWLNTFADRPEPAGLAGRSAGAVPTQLRRIRALTPETATRFAAAAGAVGSTWPAAVIAAVAAYYHRLTGREDIVFALPLAGRRGRTSLTTPGALVNVLPIRLTVSSRDTFAELAGQAARRLADVLRHQRFRGEQLFQELGLTGERAFWGPTVNVMGFGGDLALGELTAVPHPLATGPVQDLKINFYGTPATGVRLEFDADPALYDAAAVEAHQTRLVRLLTALGDDPATRIGAVDLLDGTERHHLLHTWNETAPLHTGHYLPELFAEQVARTPDAVAVRQAGTALTYAELDERANRFARYLIGRGAGPERLVGVHLPRSADLMVVLLGVLKAGAGYLPIDASYPPDRIAAVLDDARPVLLVDDTAVLAASAGLPGTPVTDAERRTPLLPQHPAYVIYTSGSTGRPKGVLIDHRALGEFLTTCRDRYPQAAGTALLHSSISFDLTVTVLFTPLVAGGCVDVADLPNDGRPPAFVKATPSHLALLEGPGDNASPTGALVLGGEQLLGEALAPWRARHPQAAVFNDYGPTETTVNCADYLLEPGDDTPAGAVPIGRPLPGNRLYVLDPALQPVPAGATGELYIGGTGLARGYVNRPGLTGQRFVADPYAGPGARMYRSGDLARLRADGNLEYLGRIDDQVKIRGYRVEPGEIEAVLASADQVARCAVVVREDRPGDQRLVAYVVAADGTVDPSALTAHLAARLPAYMVPSAIVGLDELPWTANGKVDRRALPVPPQQAPVAGRAPASPRQEILAGLFAETLGVPRVGADDDFFALGGHSLLATRLVSRVRSVFGAELTIGQVFRSPTVAGLAAGLDRAGAGRSPITARPRPGRVPLSFAQQRLRFLDLLEQDSTAYHAPGALRLTGPLDRTALAAALNDLVVRHESLRTVFAADDEGFHQVILTPEQAPVPLPVAELDEAALPDRLAAEAAQPFDLAGEPAIRARLFVLGPQDHVLLLVLHHITGDGWSMRPLARDLAAAYRARLTGGEPSWPALPVQYADYTLWQHEVLDTEGEQLGYWRQNLAGLPAELALPVDRARHDDMPAHAERASADLPAELHESLHAVAREHGASLFMVVQSALAALLTRLGAGEDIPLGTPIAGRSDAAVEDLVGFFANTLVIRADTTGDPTFGELLGRVRETSLSAYAHQDVPFERLVEELNPPRSLARHPLFQVCLTLHHADPATVVAEVTDLPGVAVRMLPVPGADAMFDLNLELTERFTPDGRPAGVRVDLDAAAGLFDPATVRALTDGFAAVLTSVAADARQRLSEVDVPALGTRPGLTPAEPVVVPAVRSRAPRTPQEQILCTLFAETLDTDAIGVDDDFFARGGHSLSAVRLLSRIRTELGAEVSIRTLFAHPTVTGLLPHLSTATRPAIETAARPARLPLSYAQQRLWFLHHLEGPSATYNIPVALRLTGDLDRSALTAALSDLVLRHESLRTVFAQDESGSYQVVLPGERARPELIVRALPSAGREEAVREAAAEPFDLGRELPVRVTLFEGTGEHVLLVVLHHIAGDGQSMGPLARDLTTAYAARAAGSAPAWAPLPVQYADYTLWQRTMLGAEDNPGSEFGRQLGYWRETLAGLPGELQLPTDRPRPPRQSYRGDRVSRGVPAELHRALRELARETRSSLVMVVQAALATTLSRLGAGTDVPIGMPIAGRTDAALEDLVGFFVNTLVLRNDVSGEPSFRDLVARVRETNLGAYAHQDVPFERLVDVLSPARSLARHPLFQVLLGFDDNTEALSALRLPGLAVEAGAPETGRAKFDLSFFFDEAYAPDGTPQSLTAALEYSTDLYDRSTAEAMLATLLRVCAGVTADPDVPVSRVDVLDDADRDRVLRHWNRAPHPVAADLVPDRLARQAAARPGELAVLADSAELTYGELDAAANRLARHLIGLGAGPEQVVAIALPRTPGMVVAMVAALKTGAAYLTLDPAVPDQRLRAVVADCGAVAVVTDTAIAPRLDGTSRAVVLDDPATAAAVTGQPGTAITDADRRGPLDPRHPAYVVYTSGSTGTPKGVVMPMGSLTNLLAWHTGTYPAAPGTRTAQFLAVSFDFAVQEILQALVAGKTLVLPAEHVRHDAYELAAWIDRYAVNELFAPRLVIDAVLAAAADRGSDLRTLTDVFQGGEAFQLGDELRAWAAGGNRRAHNVYGPAETHAVTTATMPADPAAWPATAPIGRPLWNATVFVLDARLQPVPLGAPGELYVGGAQLARGYLNRPGRTAERFVASPFGAPGDRLYRTGDLVRWTRDGELQFLGRGDHQVKIGGFRVEPGEVEGVLAAHPGVTTAVVVPRDDLPGGTRLVAYAVPDPQHDLGPDGGRRLRAHLEEHLPSYLVPAAVVLLDVLPLTPNGKLDRAALPAPEFGGSTGRGPRDDREKLLAALFAEVLGVAEVGVDEGFFDLGGDSIMSIQLVSRARRAGLELSVREVFEHRTVEALAPVVREVGTAPAEAPGEAYGDVPATPIMHWLADRVTTAAVVDTFNMSIVLQVPATLAVAPLTTAVQAVVDRHDALRARLHTEGTWSLTVPEPGSVDATTLVSRVDATDLDEPALNTLVRQHGHAARSRLDPARGVQLQLVWFDRGPSTAGLLLVLVHHIVMDGVSWRVLLPDLMEAYSAAEAGTEVRLQPVGTSLRRWAHGLVAAAGDPLRAAEAGWWRDVLRHSDPLLGARPLDPAVDTYGTAGSLTRHLDPVVTEAVLTRVPALFHAEINDVLLTAFVLAWSRWRGDRTTGLLLDLEGHGREEHLVPGADLSRTIGWFTAIFPVRLDAGPVDLADAFAGGPAAGAVLKRVKEQLRAIPDKGLGHGLARHLDPGAAPGFAGTAAPQAGFNYLGRFAAPAPGSAGWTPVFGLEAVPGEEDGLPLAHTVDLNARTEETADGPSLTAMWTWAGELLTTAQVDELAGLWFEALEALVAHADGPGAGGLTPSDVPLAVTQDEIDAFEDEFQDEFDAEEEDEL